ncbi:MAG: GNAT family N-acetyltransferase [Tabrizicola sp.]|nr:GNAT family N-acetyltransferase [Tabrizicola sp.]
MPTLTTERPTLRPPSEADFAAQLAFNDSTRTRFVGGRRDRQWVWRGLLANIGLWALRGYGFYSVDTHQGDFIGRIGVTFRDDWPEREIGWHIWDPAFEGKGHATEAAFAARDHAFDVLGWGTAVSYIHRDNTASRKVAERLGAVIDATAERPDDNDVVYRHQRRAA